MGIVLCALCLSSAIGLIVEPPKNWNAVNIWVWPFLIVGMIAGAAFIINAKRWHK